MDEHEYTSYIRAHLERAQREQLSEDRLFAQLQQRVREAARVVGEKYAVKRIYLFGSLLARETFRDSSDIDLALEGAGPEDYFDIWREFELLLEHPFDLVRIDDKHGPFYDSIRNEGVVIYEQK